MKNTTQFLMTLIIGCTLSNNICADEWVGGTGRYVGDTVRDTGDAIGNAGKAVGNFFTLGAVERAEQDNRVDQIAAEQAALNRRRKWRNNRRNDENMRAQDDYIQLDDGLSEKEMNELSPADRRELIRRR